MKVLNRIYSCFLCLMMFFPLPAQESAHFGAAKYAPEDGKKLLILGQDLGAVGGLNAYRQGYVDAMDHVPAGVTSYTGLPAMNALTDLANWGAGDLKAQLYLKEKRFDNSFMVIGLWMVGQEAAVGQGAHDKAIRRLGAWIKKAKRPVFLRIGYEFDGPWNNYSPADFIQAWKKIVSIFDNQGIKNCAFVWQSAGIPDTDIQSWYPGDEYVNWVAYSLFSGIGQGDKMLAFARQHDKPVMIAESTPRGKNLRRGNGLSIWNNWFSPYFTSIYAHDEIKAVHYINANWDSQKMWIGQEWGDSRIQVDSLINERWNIEMAKSSWIMASENLFRKLGYDVKRGFIKEGGNK